MTLPTFDISPPSKIKIKVMGLEIGDSHSFASFVVKRVSRFDFVLFDSRVTERSRWGNLGEILKDIDYCEGMDCLPLPSGPRW